jgi:hypothetical protein
MIRDELADYLGKDIVVDLQGTMLYIGRLEDVGEYVLYMGETDVHDMRDSQATTKEKYTMETRKFGVRSNRTGVRVMIDKVVAISLLDEVIAF